MGPTAAGRRRHLLIPTLVVLAPLVAACSGDDEAAPTTTVAVTAAPTTPPPTSAAPTTTAAPTTPAPTTAPPTTAPPTTAATIDPAAAEPVVAELMIDYITAVNELFRDPASEQRRSDLAALASQDALDQIIASADQYVLDSAVARVDGANPSRVEPQPITFVFAPNGDPVVGMDGCVIDTDLQVTIAADGAETVTDSTPDSFLMHFDFTALGDRWLVTSIAIDQRFEGQVGCG